MMGIASMYVDLWCTQAIVEKDVKFCNADWPMMCDAFVGCTETVMRSFPSRDN